MAEEDVLEGALIGGDNSKLPTSQGGDPPITGGRPETEGKAFDAMAAAPPTQLPDRFGATPDVLQKSITDTQPVAEGEETIEEFRRKERERLESEITEPAPVVEEAVEEAPILPKIVPSQTAFNSVYDFMKKSPTFDLRVSPEEFYAKYSMDENKGKLKDLMYNVGRNQTDDNKLDFDVSTWESVYNNLFVSQAPEPTIEEQKQQVESGQPVDIMSRFAPPVATISSLTQKALDSSQKMMEAAQSVSEGDADIGRDTRIAREVQEAKTPAFEVVNNPLYNKDYVEKNEVFTDLYRNDENDGYRTNEDISKIDYSKFNNDPNEVLNISERIEERHVYDRNYSHEQYRWTIDYKDNIEKALESKNEDSLDNALEGLEGLEKDELGTYSYIDKRGFKISLNTKEEKQQYLENELSRAEAAENHWRTESERRSGVQAIDESIPMPSQIAAESSTYVSDVDLAIIDMVGEKAYDDTWSPLMSRIDSELDKMLKNEPNNYLELIEEFKSSFNDFNLGGTGNLKSLEERFGRKYRDKKTVGLSGEDFEDLIEGFADDFYDGRGSLSKEGKMEKTFLDSYFDAKATSKRIDFIQEKEAQRVFSDENYITTFEGYSKYEDYIYNDFLPKYKKKVGSLSSDIVKNMESELKSLIEEFTNENLAQGKKGFDEINSSYESVYNDFIKNNPVAQQLQDKYQNLINRASGEDEILKLNNQYSAEMQSVEGYSDVASKHQADLDEYQRNIYSENKKSYDSKLQKIYNNATKNFYSSTRDLVSENFNNKLLKGYSPTEYIEDFRSGDFGAGEVSFPSGDTEYKGISGRPVSETIGEDISTLNYAEQKAAVNVLWKNYQLSLIKELSSVEASSPANKEEESLPWYKWTGKRPKTEEELKSRKSEIAARTGGQARAEFMFSALDGVMWNKGDSPFKDESAYAIKTTIEETISDLDVIYNEYTNQIPSGVKFVGVGGTRLKFDEGVTEEQKAVAYEVNRKRNEIAYKKAELASALLRPVNDTGFWSGLGSGMRGNLHKTIPFMSTISHLANGASELTAANKIQEGIPLNTHEVLALNGKAQADALANAMPDTWTNTGYNVGETLDVMLAYIGEYAMTFGSAGLPSMAAQKTATSVAKKTMKKSLEKAIKAETGKSVEFLKSTGLVDDVLRQMGKTEALAAIESFGTTGVSKRAMSALDLLVRSTAQTAMNPQMVFDNTMERMTPEVILAINGNFDDLMVQIQSKGEDFGEAFAKGFGMSWAEMLTEQFGHKIFSPAFKELAKGLGGTDLIKRVSLGAWLRTKGYASRGTAMRDIIRKNIGYDGVINEYLEEFVNARLSSLLTGDSGVWDVDGQQELETFLAVAVFGVPFSVKRTAISIAKKGIVGRVISDKKKKEHIIFEVDSPQEQTKAEAKADKLILSELKEETKKLILKQESLDRVTPEESKKEGEYKSVSDKIKSNTDKISEIESKQGKTISIPKAAWKKFNKLLGVDKAREIEQFLDKNDFTDEQKTLLRGIYAEVNGGSLSKSALYQENKKKFEEETKTKVDFKEENTDVIIENENEETDDELSYFVEGLEEVSFGVRTDSGAAEGETEVTPEETTPAEVKEEVTPAETEVTPAETEVTAEEGATTPTEVKEEVTTPAAEVKEEVAKGKVTFKGKELSEEEIIEEYRKEFFSLEDFGEYVEHEGVEENRAEAIERINKKRSPKFTEGSQKGNYKRSFVEALLSKHFDNKGARSLAYYIRKHFDKYFSAEMRGRGSGSGVNYSFAQRMGYVLEEVARKAATNPKAVEAFAKDVGIEIPKSYEAPTKTEVTPEEKVEEKVEFIEPETKDNKEALEILRGKKDGTLKGQWRTASGKIKKFLGKKLKPEQIDEKTNEFRKEMKMGKARNKPDLGRAITGALKKNTAEDVYTALTEVFEKTDKAAAIAKTETRKKIIEENKGEVKMSPAEKAKIKAAEEKKQEADTPKAEEKLVPEGKTKIVERREGENPIHETSVNGKRVFIQKGEYFEGKEWFEVEKRKDMDVWQKTNEEGLGVNKVIALQSLSTRKQQEAAAPKTTTETEVAPTETEVTEEEREALKDRLTKRYKEASEKKQKVVSRIKDLLNKSEDSADKRILGADGFSIEVRTAKYAAPAKRTYNRAKKLAEEENISEEEFIEIHQEVLKERGLGEPPTKTEVTPTETEVTPKKTTPTEVKEKTTKEKPAPKTTTKDKKTTEIENEISNLEEEVEDLTIEAEDAEMEVDNEKSNYNEELNRIKGEKAKVRANKKLSKEEKEERLEELEAEREDFKDDRDANIENYKDDAKEARKAIKQAESKIAKLQKQLEAEKAKTPAPKTTKKKAEDKAAEAAVKEENKKKKEEVKKGTWSLTKQAKKSEEKPVTTMTDSKGNKFTIFSEKNSTKFRLETYDKNGGIVKDSGLTMSEAKKKAKEKTERTAPAVPKLKSVAEGRDKIATAGGVIVNPLVAWINKLSASMANGLSALKPSDRVIDQTNLNEEEKNLVVETEKKYVDFWNEKEKAEVAMEKQRQSNPLTKGFKAGSAGSSNRIQAKDTSTKAKLISLDEIILKVTKALGIKVSWNTIQRKKDGWYGRFLPKRDRIDLKNKKDLDALAHEVGHKVGSQYKIDESVHESREGNSALEAEIKRLTEDGIEMPEKGSLEQTKEAVAEYIRAWAFNQAAAENQYREMTKIFEESNVSQKHKDALAQFGNNVAVYESAKSVDRAAAERKTPLVVRGQKLKGKALDTFLPVLNPTYYTWSRFDKEGNLITSSNIWDSIGTNWISQFYRLEKLVSAYEDKVAKKELLAEENPFMLARMGLGFDNKFADFIRGGGLVDINGRRIIYIDPKTKKAHAVNFDFLVEPINNGNGTRTVEMKDKVAVYMQSQRTIEYVKKLVQLDEEGNPKMKDGMYILNQQGKKVEEKEDEKEAYLDPNKITGLGYKKTDYEDAIENLESLEAEFEENEKNGGNLGESIKEAAARYRFMADQMLQYMVAMGSISQEKYNNIKTENSYYVAMHRIMNRDTDDINESLSKRLGKAAWFSRSKPDVVKAREQYKIDLNKSITGSATTIADPYVNLLGVLQVGYRTAERNNIMVSYVDMLKEMGSKYDLIDFAKNKQYKIGKNEVKVFINGQPKVFVMDAFAKNIMDAVNDSHINAPYILTVLPTILKKFITSTITFAIRNVTRDTLNRLIISRSPISLKDYKTTGKMSSEDKNRLKELDNQETLTDEESKEHQALIVKLSSNATDMLKMSGADQTAWYLKDPQSYEKLQKHAMKEAIRSKQSTVLNTARKLKVMVPFSKRWNQMMSKSEVANRLVEYKSTYRKKYPELIEQFSKEYAGILSKEEIENKARRNAMIEAGFEARDLMDFAVSGNIARTINQLIPFFNPMIQGLARGQKSLTQGNSKSVVKRILTTTIMGSAIEYSMAMMGGYDDELDKQPSYLKDMFWNFKAAPDFWIRIPKPFEMGLPSSALTRGISFAKGNDKAFEGFGQTLKHTFVPLSITKLQAVGFGGAMVDIMMNYDSFRQKDIIPFYEENLFLSERNPTFSSTLGQYIHALGIADARNVDHLVKNLFGKWGGMALDISDYLPRLEKFKDSDKYERPIFDTDRPLKSVLTALGMTAGTASSASRDVVYVVQQATGYGDTKTRRQIKKLVKSVYEKDISPSEKEDKIKRLTDYASRKRMEYEKREKDTGKSYEKTKKGRGGSSKTPYGAGNNTSPYGAASSETPFKM